LRKVRARAAAAGLVAVGLLATGCGGSDGAAPPNPTTSAAATSTAPASTSAPAATSAPSGAPSQSSPGSSSSPTRQVPPEPTPVGDTSADGLWGRAAEVVCADLAREGSPPSGKAAASNWIRDRAWAVASRLESIAGQGEQGKQMRDIVYAIGTQSDILTTIYNGGGGNAEALEAERQRSIDRLGRYAVALKAPSCAAALRVG
jgi:hypothetical protein